MQKKTFEKIQHIYDKKEKEVLNTVCIEGMYLNITKAIYDKSTVSMILNGEN